MSYEECFFCGKTNRNILSEIEFYNLDRRMPASKKPASTVLEHLASCLRTKLIFSDDTTVCDVCFSELSAYDGLMVQLMQNQKILTNKLQAVLDKNWKKDEMVINEVEPIEFGSDTQLEDALNPELDTKEELVEGDIILEADIENSIVGDEIVVDTKGELIDGDEYILADFIDHAADENSETNIKSHEEQGYIEEAEDDDDDEEEDMTIVQPDYEYLEGSLDNMLYIKPRVERECPHCGETFKSKVLLKNHVLENHKIQVFACKICGIQRKDEEYLELHMNLHLGKTEFECRYCDKKFSRPVNTLRHMRKHWDKKGYQCEKCGERFSLDNMLYNHKKRHEAEENPLICSICNQSFKSIKTYNHHQLIHQENRPRHQCPLCPKSFTERYTLKMHMNVHPPMDEIEEAKNYEENTCVICEANFSTKDLLINHLKDNHDVVVK